MSGPATATPASSETPPPAAMPASSPLAKFAVPAVSGSGGFALGLLSMFGIKELLPTQHALALTVLALVVGLILVIAIATVDMRTVKRKDGSEFAVGQWAVGLVAAVMLVLGTGGAAMFIREYYLDNMATKPPADAVAYYNLGTTSSMGPAKGLLVMVNNEPHYLKPMESVPWGKLTVPPNANIVVRVPTVAEVQAMQAPLSIQMASGTGGQE